MVNTAAAKWPPDETTTAHLGGCARSFRAPAAAAAGSMSVVPLDSRHRQIPTRCPSARNKEFDWATDLKDRPEVLHAESMMGPCNLRGTRCSNSSHPATSDYMGFTHPAQDSASTSACASSELVRADAEPEATKCWRGLPADRLLPSSRSAWSPSPSDDDDPEMLDTCFRGRASHQLPQTSWS